jgi:hypothetical protein
MLQKLCGNLHPLLGSNATLMEHLQVTLALSLVEGFLEMLKQIVLDVSLNLWEFQPPSLLKCMV